MCVSNCPRLASSRAACTCTVCVVCLVNKKSPFKGWMVFTGAVMRPWVFNHVSVKRGNSICLNSQCDKYKEMNEKLRSGSFRSETGRLNNSLLPRLFVTTKYTLVVPRRTLLNSRNSVLLYLVSESTFDYRQPLRRCPCTVMSACLSCLMMSLCHSCWVE